MTEHQQLIPPWDDETVKALNEYQQAGWMHPYTCGNTHHLHSVTLVAHTDGWHCPECEYTQQWAHTWTLGSEPPPEVTGAWDAAAEDDRGGEDEP